MNELEQCKKVLTSVLAYLSGYGESEKLVREIRDILYPEPIMEDVEEIVGWVNVYQRDNGSCFAGSICHTEESANKQWAPNGCALLSCQPIRVTVKREKKRPVERSVSFEARWARLHGVVFPVAYKDNSNIHSLEKKTGTLTFTWTEDPTT